MIIRSSQITAILYKITTKLYYYYYTLRPELEALDLRSIHMIIRREKKKKKRKTTMYMNTHPYAYGMSKTHDFSSKTHGFSSSSETTTQSNYYTVLCVKFLHSTLRNFETHDFSSSSETTTQYYVKLRSSQITTQYSAK